jgi:hypothetical protein
MSNTPRDLRRIQRWMQSVVMHPGGVEHGVRSVEAREQIDVTSDDLESVVCRSRALPADERLAIYNRAYFARLLECLRAEFPVLVHAIGDDAFDEFAIAYLQRYPSQSYTLGRLAANFTRYLAETRPDDEGAAGSAAGWPDFIIDLATLEWTFSEVFDGPGVERESMLRAEQLQGIPPERWPEARLVPAGCLRLLALRFPVNAYFSAVRRGEKPPLPQAQETFVAITRQKYVVRHYPLSPPQYALLAAIAERRAIGDAIVEMAKVAEGEIDVLADQVRLWFRHWAIEGFFSAVELPGPE